jgi:uncharacterized protein YabE (DUF348 family)
MPAVIIKEMVWRFVDILVLVISVSIFGLSNSALAQDQSTHLITLYDRGTEQVFLAKEKTVGEALKAKHIELDARDTVEPSVDEKLVASNYYVNIYRARPVVVVDGNVRIKTVSSHQTAGQIASDAGITIYDGDTTTLKPLTDFITDGAGLELTITRAKPITLDLYGNQTQIRTQAKTVGDMLKEKNIILGKNGRVSVPETTPITQDMQIRVWREGAQTVSIDQEIPVVTKIVYDADQPIGYRVIQTEGMQGIQSITYQLDIEGGVEVSRVEIASITTRNPTEQIEVIGFRNDGSGLTKAKSAQYNTDSKGVSHRETYYDLNMSTALESCGQGGHYSVRPDGAKVDAEGYIIVAADYSIYPKCSIVETSLGLGKVYDTGGFVARYPNGFDLATDWTTPDGI